MILLSLIIPFLLGYLFIDHFTQNTPPSQKHLNWVISLPFGFGLLSLLLFISYLLANNKGFPLALSLSVLVISFLYLLKLSNPKRSATHSRSTPTLSGLTKIFSVVSVFFLVYFLCYYWNYFWIEASNNPLGGWDGRYFWNLKARFFFRDPLEWKAMFSPIMKEWAHPDYPILIPGTVAWGWFVLQKEILLWPIVVSFIYPVSICLLLFTHLRDKVNIIFASLAVFYLTSIHTFYFWSTTQYTDIPLSFYFLASYVFFIRALEQSKPSLFAITGLLLGMSLWTKDEGYFFSMIIFGIAFILLFNSKLNRTFKVTMWLSLIAGISLFFLASLITKKYLGTAGGQFAGSGRGLTDYLELLFGEAGRTRFILHAFKSFLFSFQAWNAAWILFSLALLISLKSFFKNFRWVLPLLILGQLLGYFIVIHLTRYDLRFQIESALMRLILHLLPLTIVFIFEIFGSFYPKENKQA